MPRGVGGGFDDHFAQRRGPARPAPGRGGRRREHRGRRRPRRPFNYPSLGRLLEGGDPRALEEMRGRLARTRQELERVVRQGTREDAERAGRASRAVTLTLSLLDALDAMRREGASR